MTIIVQWVPSNCDTFALNDKKCEFSGFEAPICQSEVNISPKPEASHVFLNWRFYIWGLNIGVCFLVKEFWTPYSDRWFLVEKVLSLCIQLDHITDVVGCKELFKRAYFLAARGRGRVSGNIFIPSRENVLCKH